jgi:hypothetical protein
MNAIENQWLLVYQSHSITMSRFNESAEIKFDLQLSMQEKLTRFIDKEMNSKVTSKSRTTTDVMGIVKKELVTYFRSRRQTWS